MPDLLRLYGATNPGTRRKESSMTDPDKTQFSIQVPAEVRDRLDVEAKRQNRSRNAVINRILEKELGRLASEKCEETDESSHTGEK